MSGKVKMLKPFRTQVSILEEEVKKLMFDLSLAEKSAEDARQNAEAVDKLK